MTNSVASGIQSAIPVVLRPLIRLLIRSGISYGQFSAIAKQIFVEIASQEIKPPGSGNLSRIAARTGLSRKSVRAIREELATSSVEGQVESTPLNPLTVVLHHWYNDPCFINAEGAPRSLPFSDSEYSFSNLVRKYAGDLPPGAVRAELRAAGAVIEDLDGTMQPVRSFLTPATLNDEFVRSMAFSWSNLGETLTRNAELYDRSVDRGRNTEGLFERYVWTDRLSEVEIQEFKFIAEAKAGIFLGDLDRWIGSRESRGDLQPNQDGSGQPVTCGVGLYYFERR